MIRARFVVTLIVCLWLAAAFSYVTTARNQLPPDPSTSVIFFDVSDLPARIDEPKLQKDVAGYSLKGAIANRSGEQLLGLRLFLLVVERSGKTRSRVTWTEAFDSPGYSIKTFAFHPELSEAPRANDQLFLAVDEVIGHETIWRAMEVDKALRGYSRGRHDVMPVVRTVANKFDPRNDAMKIIWR
jgi:hypothetical protein